MPTYSWITLQQAVNALQGRLQNSVFWPYAECVIYLTEALRLWNGLTEQWNSDFVLTAQGSQWINTGTLSRSPRLRSVTDSYLYTQMQYMLLEPPTGGGTWTGTNQFNLASFQDTLQKRRDEVIQASGCNYVQLSPLSTTPGARRTQLPDTVLEPKRCRFLGVVANTAATALSGANNLTVASTAGITAGLAVKGTGIAAGCYATSVSGNTVALSLPTTGAVSSTVQFLQPVTLTREDTQAFQYFEPDYLQQYGFPQSWSVPSEPPLAFDVDIAPTVPGTYDMIALQSGPAFAPPTATLLGVPDDWSWLPMYGALADLLLSESERTDRPRGEYCLKRFQQGLEMMKQSNWLVQAAINNYPCDTPSLFEQDCYRVEWQTSGSAWPAIVQAGIDFVNVCPVAFQSATVTLVANAPIPASSGDYVQVSRDVFDVILSYAQRLAMFKEGGAEWMEAESLEKDFYRAASETNKRLLKMGIFTDVLHTAGQREDTEVPR